MQPDSQKDASASPASSNPGDTSPSRVPWTESIPLAVALFAFWTVLSGKLDLLHLGLGAVSAVAISVVSLRLYAIEPPIGPRGRHPFASLPWLRLALYVPWLFGQIAVASFQVASVVLRPKMPIRPRMFRFRQPLPTNVARATLANSITLTPGTVTIDVLGDEYLVHALTEEGARGLEGEEPSAMKTRVTAVFSA